MVNWKEWYERMRRKERKFGMPLLCLLGGFTAGLGAGIFKWKWLAILFLTLGIAGLIYYAIYLTSALIIYLSLIHISEPTRPY